MNVPSELAHLPTNRLFAGTARRANQETPFFHFSAFPLFHFGLNIREELEAVSTFTSNLMNNLD
jgi:hypothetical protein